MITKPIGPGPSVKINNCSAVDTPPVGIFSNGGGGKDAVPIGKDTPPIGKDVGPVAKFDPVGFGEDRKDTPPFGIDNKIPFKPQGPYPDKDGAGLGIEFVSFDEEQHSIYDDLAEWQGGLNLDY